MFGRPTREERNADEQESKKGFALTIGTKLFACVYFVAVFIVALVRSEVRDFSDPDKLGDFSGMLFVGFIASLVWLTVPVAIAWYASKSRSVADRTCFVMLILFFTALFGGGVVSSE